MPHCTIKLPKDYTTAELHHPNIVWLNDYMITWSHTHLNNQMFEWLSEWMTRSYTYCNKGVINRKSYTLMIQNYLFQQYELYYDVPKSWKILLKRLFFITQNHHMEDIWYKTKKKYTLLCIKGKYTIHKSLDCGNRVVLMYIMH